MDINSISLKSDSQEAGKYPGIDQVRNLISGKIKAGIWQHGERLPSIRQLANMAAVSPSTVAKTLVLLRGQGLVNGLKRHRMFVGSSMPVTKSAGLQHAATPVRNTKRILIEKEILQGVFGLSGALPSMKIFAARYGICFRTARKILGRLVQEGVIASRGHRYFLAGSSNRWQNRQIIFITVSEHLQQVSALNQKYNQVANLLESKCIELGMRLIIVQIDFWDSDATELAISSIKNQDQVLGYIFDAWWYVQEQFQQNLLKVFDRIARFDKPVAVLDELGCFNLPIQYATNPFRQVFRIQGAKAGEKMARLLYSNGHEHIVYLSPLHYSQWSQERFAGVSGYYARMGMADNVYLCAENLEVHLPYILVASGLSSKDIRALLSVSRTPSQTADIMEQWKTFVDTVPKPYAGYPRLPALTKKNLADLASLAQKKCDPLFRQKSVEGALDAAGNRIYDIMIAPLFKKALSRSETTAWICATDDLAIRASAFLDQQRIEVPGRISICGFDNIPMQALGHRLTTFDFNAYGFINHMLNFILHPPRPRGQWRHKVIEVEGFVVERETTARRKP
jgi:DNA-binding LacI/PurR family transcriptional regulator